MRLAAYSKNRLFAIYLDLVFCRPPPSSPAALLRGRLVFDKVLHKISM